MSKLKHPYHVVFENYPGFKVAWDNTDPATITGWIEACSEQSNSSYATLWSFWKIWTHQLNDPTRTNAFYIEWLYPSLQLPWPYGTKWIPTAELNRAICGYALLSLTVDNSCQ